MADQKQLDQWFEEEVKLPVKAVDEQGNVKLVEKVVKTKHMLTTPQPHRICPPETHYFELDTRTRAIDGRLTAKCRNCPLVI